MADTVSHALAHEERADRLEARVNRLEALVRELAEHAHHRPDCAEMEDYYAPCDCGLTEAVRRARKEVGDG